MRLLRGRSGFGRHGVKKKAADSLCLLLSFQLNSRYCLGGGVVPLVGGVVVLGVVGVVPVGVQGEATVGLGALFAVVVVEGDPAVGADPVAVEDVPGPT